jgi:CubicO group peptidase (beta-lactamase class C family)
VRLIIFAAAAVIALAPPPSRAQALPVFNPGGPNAEAYGSADGYPAGYPQTQRMLVGNFSHYETVSRTRKVARAATPSLFERAPAEIDLHYTYRGATHTISDYLSRHPTTGLLIIKDNTILSEHYQYGRTETDKFMSQSMSKTVASMLVGIALSEGRIKSLDDPAATYVTGLADSEIGVTPIRALLHMASGINFREVYDGHDDSAALNNAIWSRNGEGAVVAARRFNVREAAPDTLWHYKGLDTETIGLVLREATGETLSDYLSEKIWQRIGTESDAAWAIDAHGQEPAFCCLNVTLRDWGRLGKLLAHDGSWNGEQIIPKDYVIAATTPSAPFLSPGKGAGYYGYGYQVWLLPGSARQFVLIGIHGQMLYVDPASKLVLVHTAVRPTPTGDPMAPELGALWRGLLMQEGGG